MVRQRRKAAETDICPYCKVGRLVPDPVTGAVSCSDCGAFYKDEILVRNKTENIENGLSGTTALRFRKWQKRIRVSNATERNLAFALSELDRVSTASGLPRQVRESASGTYRKAVSHGLVRGRSIELLAAASVYAACRSQGMPRTIDEIAEAAGVEKKSLGRTFRFISKSLRLNLLPAKPQDYVHRYCSKLGLNEAVWDTALDILQGATDKGLVSGLGPAGIAAAAVYIASQKCNDPRSQKQVSEAVGISEVTLRSRFKELKEGLGIEVVFGGN